MQGMRLLIVEDEPRMALLLRRGLIDEGYAADVVGAGADCLASATSVQYDLVLLDLLLPDLDGFEVCRRLRQQNCWAPVLMLTARDSVTDRVRGLDAGADDYLVKPFSFAELCARVRALIRRGTHQRPTILTVGRLRLDPASRLAWLGQREVRLSAKEFALLELFLRYPGQVLTRSRLLDHAWDFTFDGTSNVVDQYVGYLRRKLAPDLIETVRGAGYRLRVPAAR
jgi:two-component system OmpR family response regulator